MHKALAMTSGTGLRFISDLEKGKPTRQLGRALGIFRRWGGFGGEMHFFTVEYTGARNE